MTAVDSRVNSILASALGIGGSITAAIRDSLLAVTELPNLSFAPLMFNSVFQTYSATPGRTLDLSNADTKLRMAFIFGGRDTIASPLLLAPPRFGRWELRTWIERGGGTLERDQRGAIINIPEGTFLVNYSGFNETRSGSTTSSHTVFGILIRTD